jgi:hypothetical protein
VNWPDAASVEQRVSPSAAFRKSLAVLFDDESLREDVWHIDDEGASALFFGFHWSFTILEPSGKGWPLPGTPALYALIMVGLATMTLSTSSVRAEETTAQSSYPLKSANAIPLGDFSEYCPARKQPCQDSERCGGYRNREPAIALHG